MDLSPSPRQTSSWAPLPALRQRKDLRGACERSCVQEGWGGGGGLVQRGSIDFFKNLNVFCREESKSREDAVDKSAVLRRKPAGDI